MDKDNSASDLDKDSEFGEKLSSDKAEVLGDLSAEEQKPAINNDAFTDENSLSMDTQTENSENGEIDGISLSHETYDQDVDEELYGINLSLAQQIREELDITSSEEEKLKRKRRLFKIQSKVVLLMLSLIGILFFLGFTKPGNKLLLNMGVNVSGSIWGSMTNRFKDNTDVSADIDFLDDDDMNSTAPEIDPSTIVWPERPGDGRQEDGVYNILLLGEEAIGNGDSRGRTDVIVIATMNTKSKELKLTSLMRDMLVRIPGYKDNRLNTVFEKGGHDLLYETIALNLDIKLDGCVMVNFEDFEEIIDSMGGLEITLTKGEASYLNKTNYISDPANRNVVEGTQVLNGNQVLGYSRVRKRSTITGNNNDFGRTDRHRIVLNAIFDKVKSKSKADLLAMMFNLLDEVTTDIDNKCFQMLLNSFIDMGMNELDLEQLRVPVDGAFDGNVRVRGMSVLIPDYEKNIDALHEFIFGDATSAKEANPSNVN